jgi:hypothetical protein
MAAQRKNVPHVSPFKSKIPLVGITSEVVMAALRKIA